MAEDDTAKVFDLDIDNHSRGLWLLKVPKYLAEQWQTREEGCNLGTIEFSNKKDRGESQTQVLLNVSESSVVNTPGEPRIPLVHTLKMSECKNLSMSVFSESPDSVRMEGKVSHRADIQIDSNYMQEYMKMKRKKIQTLEISKKNKYEPKSLPYNPNNIIITPRVKELNKIRKDKMEEKHTRSDKEDVIDRIFQAFKNFQFYTFSDLVKITKQPQGYLRVILKDVCTHHTHGPHKNTWELKPEYKTNED